jgi:tRNA pseudouridine55 synthase
MTKSGLLLIDKPEGPSSAHVVHLVKAVIGAKKIGHLGTLDPFASGLLLLGVNEGTKVADVFLRAPKSYRGIIALGIETDSQDATGAIVEVRNVPLLGEKELRSLERQFTGELQQVPPMFSALKKDGARLYQLARQGKEVPREPRGIRIDRIVLRKVSAAELEIELDCSRGTYVRTVASDVGKALGCGGHLKALRRLACGHLTLTRAVTLVELNDLVSQENVPLMPIATALNHLRAVSWDSPWLTRLRLGQQEILNQIGKPLAGKHELQILDRQGQIVALVEWQDAAPRGRWRLVQTFRA